MCPRAFTREKTEEGDHSVNVLRQMMIEKYVRARLRDAQCPDKTPHKRVSSSVHPAFLAGPGE